MAPLQLLSQYSADPKAQITERVYQHAMQNLSKTNNELLICGKVQDVIGQANVTKLHQRFSCVSFRIQHMNFAIANTFY